MRTWKLDNSRMIVISGRNGPLHYYIFHWASSFFIDVLTNMRDGRWHKIPWRMNQVLYLWALTISVIILTESFRRTWARIWVDVNEFYSPPFYSPPCHPVSIIIHMHASLRTASSTWVAGLRLNLNFMKNWTALSESHATCLSIGSHWCGPMPIQSFPFCRNWNRYTHADL